MDIKPHELKTIIAGRFRACAETYDLPGRVFDKRDLIGELVRLLVLVESLPDK